MKENIISLAQERTDSKGMGSRYVFLPSFLNGIEEFFHSCTRHRTDPDRLIPLKQVSLTVTQRHVEK